MWTIFNLWTYYINYFIYIIYSPWVPPRGILHSIPVKHVSSLKHERKEHNKRLRIVFYWYHARASIYPREMWTPNISTPFLLDLESSSYGSKLWSCFVGSTTPYFASSMFIHTGFLSSFIVVHNKMVNSHDLALMTVVSLDGVGGDMKQL